MQLSVDALIELDETRREAHARNAKLKMQVKNLYDRRAIVRSFQVNYLVLMWNARLKEKGKHQEFDAI